MLKFFRGTFITFIIALMLWINPAGHAFAASQDRKPGEQPGRVDKEREQVLRGLIDELDGIMQSAYNKKPGDEARKVYLVVKKKLKSHDLVLTIREDGKKEVFAAFSPGEKGEKPCIQVNEALIDSARKKPTLAMTMLMHEMKHARDYFTIGEPFREHMKNRLENFMYEMDALFIEALFIRDFLAPRYTELTPFEQYVLTSLDKDNLASVALVFLSEDMDLTYDLYDLGKKLDKGMACKDYFDQFAKQGKAVFERPIPTDEFGKLQALVAIKTFTTLAAPLADGAMARNKRCKQDDYKAEVKELNEYVRRGNAILREQGSFIEEYVAKIRSKFFVIS